jgi:hypothetical protein
VLKSVNDRLDFALISIKSRHRFQRGKRHLVYIVAGNDNDPSRSHGSGRGVSSLQPARYTQAMHVQRNGTDARRMEASDFDLNCFVELTI